MTTDALVIRHEEADNRGAFFIERDGQRLAEMNYDRIDAHRANFHHTEVSPKLQGLGIARRLLGSAVAWARSTKTHIVATCPYVKSQFEKDPSIRDVLDPSGEVGKRG